ncbi:hypothetical protein BDV93DRAFT_602450 [Ceratobasidium sp. AG-I]|nr:hypothetical protein BDV93DRAFT_602450 [Ceratobasidium sp. AG-I]
MSTFDSLPEDVLRLVLILSTPATIRYCQQVCRLLRNVIQADPYIQYLLDLDACGYVEPRNPRSDLSYSEKREVIRRHQLRWTHPQHVSPEIYDLHAIKRSFQCTYVNGVYARGARISGSMPKATRQLHFYQLPSPNRGTEYKHWLIPDLGVDTHFFMIDPEQDLLVLAEAHNANQDSCVYSLHLRTMSDGKTHPKTLLGSSTLVCQLQSMCPPTAPHSEICGHLLAVIFPSRHALGLSCVVIWNWALGIELTRVQAINQHSSFTLLSDNFLVLPYFVDPFSTQRAVSRGESGALNVYRFDPQANASTESTHVASFVIPALNQSELLPNIYIFCTPTARAPTTEAGPMSYSKLFESAPDNRLLCIDIVVVRLSDASTRIATRALYVHSSALLDVIAGCQEHQAGRTVIPWVDWAEKTSWVDIAYLDKRGGFGQRIAGFDSTTFSFDPELDILDFDQHRIRTRLASEAQAEWEVHTPSGQNSDDELFDQIEENIFCGRSNLAKRQYMKDAFPVLGGLQVEDALMVDEEHVVVETRRSAGHRALVVYTF